MGCVICYGALITMFFILTIMPIAYWKVMGKGEVRENKEVSEVKEDTES
jgi:hypothetical protein